ncbi:hypothetical protein BX600DRAFT_461861 [Xylariales sp. PMI_506]|nr:hypothetical protein BX600DRAFT_461861 [Xylariales sp. PMI_506]
MAILDFSSEHPSIFAAAFGAPRRKGLLIAICMSFLLFQLLFLANASYIFGILFRASSRIQAFNVLFVDYDGGVIGESIRAAYSNLEGPGFVSLDESSSLLYPSATDVQDAVCRGSYWGAVYVPSGASQQLTTALLSSPAAAAYDPSGAATAVNLGIRYPVVQQGYIEPGFASLFAAARAAFFEIGLDSSSSAVNLTAAASVLADPLDYTTVNLAPTPQGTTPFYNTAVTVFIILMQFFCVLALNGIYLGFGLFGSASIASQLGVRFVYSAIFTFVGSLVTSGYLWAFRESWPVTGSEFGQAWMAIWLGMHVHWLVLDAAAGFLPIAGVPFFTFTWIIVNLASTVMPFEISPGFYRIGYAFPSHHIFELLIQIWSGGCFNRLYRSLPILFVWEIAAAVADIFSQVSRCKKMQYAHPEDNDMSIGEQAGSPEEATAVSIEAKGNSDEELPAVHEAKH